MTGQPGGVAPEEFPPEDARETPAARALPEDLPAEASGADVQEQHEPVTEEPPPVTGEIPAEAPEADVTEQRQEVTLDEEDAPIG